MDEYPNPDGPSLIEQVQSAVDDGVTDLIERLAVHAQFLRSPEAAENSVGRLEHEALIVEALAVILISVRP